MTSANSDAEVGTVLPAREAQDVRRGRLDIAIAASALLVLCGGGLLGAGPAVCLPAAILTAMVFLLAVFRRSTARVVEVVAVTTTALLAVLVLGGILLSVLPVGMTRTGWVGIVAIGGAVLLGWTWRRPVTREPALPGPASTLFAVLGVALAVGAVTIGVLGADRADVAPLQMWRATPVTQTGPVVVELSAAGPIGPYDLWLEQEGVQPVVVSSGFSVGAGTPVRFELPDPADSTEAYSVVLRSPGSTEAVRTLVVQPSTEDS